MTLGAFLFYIQWWLYAIFIGDKFINVSLVRTLIAQKGSTSGQLLTFLHLQVPNLIGIFINSLVFVLYFFYPPLTWSVPLLGRDQGKKLKE